VVALSGGLDSTALLHALRFGAGRRAVTAAHLDHVMRPDSSGARAWVEGVCRAWGVPLEAERLERAPASEEAAREARYRFLERIRARVGAVGVVTGHHADDQAETVLFRIARGAGLRGLAGMRPARGRLHRPLLELRRCELEAYARAAGLRWREDPTNLDPRFARNRIRHRTLPALAARPGGVGASRLLEISARARQVLERSERLDDALLAAAARRTAPGRLEFDGPAFEGLSPEGRLRTVRHGAHRVGGHLSSAATRIAARALRELVPGQGVDLTGGLRLERGLAGWILLAPAAARARRSSFTGGGEPRGEACVPVDPGTEGEGSMELRLAGQGWRLGWGREPAPGGLQARFSRRAHLPLRVRGWRPGDRIRLSYGSKSVAKLLAEAGVSALDRPAAPVFLGEGGAILWVPGASPGPAAGAAPDEHLYITCTRIPA
jgi:tRNA(Ile)-lysidine synthase